MEDEGSYGRGLRPEDMVPDEDMQYESEEENIEAKIKEKPVGPPLELEIPFRPPPAHPDKVLIHFCCHLHLCLHVSKDIILLIYRLVRYNVNGTQFFLHIGCFR